MRAVLTGALGQWAARAARLPRLVPGLVGLALLVALALAALDFHREGLRLEGRLRGAEARLAEVRGLAGALAARAGAAGSEAGQTAGSPLARTDAALRAAGLADATLRLELQGQAVRVELGPHDWPAFARLLEGLERRGLHALEARVEAVTGPGGATAGRVQARLTIGR